MKRLRRSTTPSLAVDCDERHIHSTRLPFHIFFSAILLNSGEEESGGWCHCRSGIFFFFAAAESSRSHRMVDLSTCSLDVSTTLPLLCVCTLLSFLCGVGIGANDLSANFAMVVGSGSLNMKQAIIYCTVFELLGAAFMGGHVSSTIRNGIVEAALFNKNKSVVVLGMTSASFAAALWLYMSTVFGLPVSITHTVVGSIVGFAVFASNGFTYVKSHGLVVIVISWVAAPLAACAVTTAIFYVMRRDIFKVKGRSFELALRILPFCLAASLLIDFFFIVIEKPPIMTQTLTAYVPLVLQYVILLLLIFLFCWAVEVWVFPQVAEAAMSASSFVWESEALRTEPETVQVEREVAEELNNVSFFKPRHHPPPQTLLATTENDVSGTVDEGLDTPERSRALSHPPSQELRHLGENTSLTISECSIPAPHHIHSSASLVLSSMTPLDGSFVRRGRTVRLAPISSRTISPLNRTNASSSASHQSYLPGHNTAATREETHLLRHAVVPPVTAPVKAAASYGTATATSGPFSPAPASSASSSSADVCSEDEFGEADWLMDHPMQPIRFGGILIKPFNPRAEYLFTGLQVVAGSMSSFVHGAVAGANATATFVILYESFTDHELGEPDLSSQWSVLPAMLGIAIGMFGLGASLMKTVGVELVTVTPLRGWCIQTGGTLVTMILTGIGIPVSLSQSQIGAAIGCGVLDAKLGGVSWSVVFKVVAGWVITLLISSVTTGIAMWVLGALLC